MNVILRNSEGEIREIKYPGLDVSKPPRVTKIIEGEKVVVEGWPDGEQAYVKMVSAKPSYDSRTHKLVKTETWTETPWNGHYHILIYEISWETEQLSDEQIAENLKNEYVAWKYGQYSREDRDSDNDRRIQISYLAAKNLTYDTGEETRQLAIGAWQQAISDQYYAQKDALLNNGTLPSFTFDPFPS